MSEFNSGRNFSGSVAQLYERYMAAPIFETFAEDLTRRLVIYNDDALISAALVLGGFMRNNSFNSFNSVTAQSVFASAAIVATAYCHD